MTSCKKYLLSICYIDYNNDIFSEPFGLFDTFIEAECFAHEKIDELRREYVDELNEMIVDEEFEFDFTVKEVYVKI